MNSAAVTAHTLISPPPGGVLLRPACTDDAQHISREIGAEKSLNAFETLTLAPIDRRLVAPQLLTTEEAAWLDAYHARVRAEIGPLLDAKTSGWLEQATAPVAG